MPPNVKSVANISESLSSLDLTSIVKSPFLPLTHPDEQARVEAEVRQEQSKHQHDDDEEEDEYVTATYAGEESYWDWPDEPELTEAEKQGELVEQIFHEEEIRQVLSVSRVEERLVTDAKAKEADDEWVTAKDDGEVVGYWDMPSEEPIQDEATANENIVTAQHVRDVTHPRQSYWDWDAAPVTASQRKKNLIESILREEELRETLDASKIECRLKGELSRASGEEVVNVHSGSDDYWSFEERVFEAPHVGDDDHPRSTYWDWQQPTPEEGKRLLINLVLKEDEIRQCIAVERAEELLLEESKRQEGEYQQRMVASGDASYWDM